MRGGPGTRAALQRSVQNPSEYFAALHNRANGNGLPIQLMNVSRLNRLASSHDGRVEQLCSSIRENDHEIFNYSFGVCGHHPRIRCRRCQLLLFARCGWQRSGNRRFNDRRQRQHSTATLPHAENVPRHERSQLNRPLSPCHRTFRYQGTDCTDRQQPRAHSGLHFFIDQTERPSLRSSASLLHASAPVAEFTRNLRS